MVVFFLWSTWINQYPLQIEALTGATGAHSVRSSNRGWRFAPISPIATRGTVPHIWTASSAPNPASV